MSRLLNDMFTHQKYVFGVTFETSDIKSKTLVFYILKQICIIAKQSCIRKIFKKNSMPSKPYDYHELEEPISGGSI